MKLKYILPLLILFHSVISPASLEEVKLKIEKILNKLNASTKVGLLIYNPLTQDTIFSVNHRQSMIPASNTKLFTTAVALETMGGDYALSTKLFTDDDNLSDGEINGNLYIKGYGNSTFTSDDLEKMVIKLNEMKIKSITGNIIGDDTYFDEVYTRDDWIKDERANVKLPPVSALVLDRNKTTIRKKRRGRYRNYFAYVSDPPTFVAKELRQKLIDYKISVKGNSIKGETPAKVNFITESSIDLRDLIKEINKHSDNFLAECLFKTIGAVTSGEQGNSFYSTQAILSFIKDNGIFSEGTAVVDGSGISRFDQITVGALIGLLERMYFDIANFDDFYDALSIAGVDGTLEDRMRRTPAENNFHGKTGTLNGVSSVSGYVTTEDGEDLIVSMIFEFEKGGTYMHRDIQDEIIEALAGLKEGSPDDMDQQDFETK
jgi:serine-type D-Ala-D-Ala carboxypeptidase/endopeptidase (penicillin-binding protein 4)